MRRTIVALVMAGMAPVGACQAPSPAGAARTPVHAQLVVMGGGGGGPDDACFRCHGLDGSGDGASPRLAGLPAGYLEKQLLDYAAERRPDKLMSPISRMLSEEERRALARHYAELPAPAAPSAGVTSAAGGELYWRGSPRQGAPACAACHGSPAAGRGPAFPPLAGQPAPYIRAQLERWRRGERRNDPLGVMVVQARRLSDVQITEVAAYLASQSPNPSGLNAPAAAAADESGTTTGPSG